MVWPIQQQRPNSSMVPHHDFFRGGMHQPQTPREWQQFLPPQVSQNLLSPERIDGFSQKLTNVQQILNVVQKTAPIVQQYGPMVKNLPMLFKLMKAFNEDDSEPDDSSGHENQAENDKELDIAVAPMKEDKSRKMNETVKTGESTPKLFI